MTQSSGPTSNLRSKAASDAALDTFARAHAALRSGLAQIIVSQEPLIDEVLWALLGGGHILIEGVPGLGKTLLVRTLGSLLGGRFSRVQFTPDLMPTDITGSEVLARGADGSVRFDVHQGPVFANVILADEINRATPRTQAGLLEAMEEGTVTIGRATFALPRPFFVVATQNPLDLEGTYPLPEAQLDRFLLQARIESPGEAALVDIFRRHGAGTAALPSAVLEPAGTVQAIAAAAQVPVADAVARYAARLVLATHPQSAARGVAGGLRQGAGPRAMLALLRCGRVRALAAGREHIAFEDVRAAAPAALRHRLRLRYEREAEGDTIEQAIVRLLSEVQADA
jgi:MoxR-like ATPase